ncbi:MAG: hypothetical protein ACI35P_07465 [Bacillus sp. (in: firmicutes)]
MKFTRIIAFSLVSALSIGTLVTVAEINKTSVNRDFTITDLQGNRDVLDAVTFENIIKTDTNSFEKVQMTNEEVTFSKTKYDLTYRADEHILDNKDLYRGDMGATEYENEQLLLTAGFNSHFPYISDEPYVKLAMKNKETNDITKETVSVPNISTNQSILEETLFEMNERIFYCITTSEYTGQNDNKVINIYEVNLKTLELNEVMMVDANLSLSTYTEVSSLASDGEKLYSVLSSEKEVQLLVIDPVANKGEKVALSFVAEDGYVQQLEVDEKNLYVHLSSGVQVINKSSLKSENGIVTPSFADDYDYVYAVDQQIKDNQLFVIYEAGTYETNKSDMFIAVYDYEKAETLYEGKLPSMTDRGVGKSYTFMETE